MLPVSVAHVAVVRMELPDQQVLPATAHGTRLGADDRKIARDQVVGGNSAGDRRRSGVLPAMTGLAPVWMFGARLDVRRCQQLPAHLTMIPFRCRRDGDLRGRPRRWARAESPVETPLARRPS